MISCQLNTLPDHDEPSISSPSDTLHQFHPDQMPMATMHSDPLMNSLSYSLLTATSPLCFQSPTLDSAWEEMPVCLMAPIFLLPP